MSGIGTIVRALTHRRENGGVLSDSGGPLKMSDDALLRKIYDKPPKASHPIDSKNERHLANQFATALLAEKPELRAEARVTDGGDLWLPQTSRQTLAQAIGKATPVQDWSSFGVRVMLAALVLVMSLAINSAMSKSFSHMSKKLGAWLYAVVTLLILAGFILIVTFLFKSQRRLRARRLTRRTGIDFQVDDLELVPVGGTTRNLLSQFYTAYRA